MDVSRARLAFVALPVAVAAAVAWLLYERSLPIRVAPEPFIRDASSLAIGIGVYLLVGLALLRPSTRAPLPLARAR